MFHHYEISTTSEELSQDEALAKYLLLDGLRSQAEQQRLKKQTELQTIHPRSIFRERSRAEKARQEEDRNIFEALVRKYGRHIIISDPAFAAEWGGDEKEGLYERVDFSEGTITLKSPSGTDEIEYAELRFDAEAGMQYRVVSQVLFPARLALTAEEYADNKGYLPSL